MRQKGQKPYSKMTDDEVTSFVSGMKSNAEATLSGLEQIRKLDKGYDLGRYDMKVLAQQILVLCHHIETLSEDNRKARGALNKVKAILLAE
jgi:hypothetical protein